MNRTHPKRFVPFSELNWRRQQIALGLIAAQVGDCIAVELHGNGQVKAIKSLPRIAADDSVEDSAFIGFWLNAELAALMDRAVAASESDRSKFVRSALREKLERTAL